MTTPFFTWMAISMAALVHPFFISMTEINHNAANKTLEVSVPIFTDDFEKALEKSCGCKIDLLKPTDKTIVDKTVTNYITSHLQITADGKPTVLQFAGYQQEQGSIWSYFEAKNVTTAKRIEVTNNLLYEYKTEQINMVHVLANGKEKTEKLDYPERVLEFGM